LDEEVPVLLETDDPKTTTRDDPQALIEEARHLQRQRARRRTIVVQAAALLVILGFGINHFARGGNSAGTAPQQPLTDAAQTPNVTYRKIVGQSFVPHLPVETQTVQIWSSSATPDVVRAIVTFAQHRRSRFEFGLVYKHDKVFGVPERELVFYFYDAPTDTIYRIGSTLGTLPPLPPPGQIFKQVLTAPFARLEGTRTYGGRSVDVVLIQDPNDPAVTKQTLYLDKRTHEIVRSDIVFTGNRPQQSPQRVLDRAQQRTLPATKANLALTSLQAAHPGARIARVEQPRIKRLNGALPYIDSFAYIEMMMR
jgi:hypothetical protein